MSVLYDTVLETLAGAGDGVVTTGITLAYVSYRILLKFSSNSSLVNKVQEAPSVSVSDLRSIISGGDDDATERLVIVNGVVGARSPANVLISPESSCEAVALLRTQKDISCDKPSGLSRWTLDFLSQFVRSWQEENTSSLTGSLSSITTVPFILSEDGRCPQSDFVIVNLDGSKHPLPLTTMGLLDEEKILPIGKEITGVGICSFKAGTLEIKSCPDFPFFLSYMGKDQIVQALAFRSKVLLWSGVVLGSMAIGILGYASELEQMERVEMSTADTTPYFNY